MDEDGAWLNAIERILELHSHPRHVGERPLRLSLLRTLTLEAPLLKVITRSAIAQGRRLYGDMMIRGHRSFYYGIMAECARR